MSTWAKDLSRTCQMMLELERKYWRDKRQVVYSFVSSITMEGRMKCRDNSIGCTLMSMSLYLISDILQNYTSGFKKFPKKEQKLKVRKFFHTWKNCYKVANIEIWIKKPRKILWWQLLQMAIVDRLLI